MFHCMLTPPTDESVITYTQLSGVQRVDIQEHVIEDVKSQLSFKETELDGEAGFGDVARSGMESSGLIHDESFGVDDLDLNLNEAVDLNEPIVEEARTQELILEEVRTQEPIVEDGNGQEDESTPSDEQFFYDDEWIDTAYDTQYDVHYSEDADTNDDDEDNDFLVDKENKIVEPNVDVHLFSISMDVPFDNIGVTNLVVDDVLKGEDVDVINTDSFDSDPGNDDETSNYTRRRLAELSREMEGTGLTSPNHGMEAGLSGSSGPTNRSKKRKNTCTNDDSQACSSALDAHDKGDLCPWVFYKFLSKKIFDQVRVNLKIPVKAVQDQLQRDLEL
ncbi:hypothetical protein Tco_0578729 [Tanacetum coccineum]